MRFRRRNHYSTSAVIGIGRQPRPTYPPRIQPRDGPMADNLNIIQTTHAAAG
jgi:hypothetical protein